MGDERRRSLGRQREDRKWPRHLRDFWMVCVTALVVIALSDTHGTVSRLQRDGRALCSFRDDLQQRVSSGNAFLKTHPHGIAGIPAGTIRVSIQNEQHTLNALRPLAC